MTYDLPTLRDLLVRVEAATGADRELDWLLAEIFGDVPAHTIRDIGFDYNWFRLPGEYTLWKATDSEGRGVQAWQPEKVSSSIDAAVALIDQVLPGARWGASNSHNRVNLWQGTGNVLSSEGAASIPLAFISALLKALITRDTQHGNDEG